MFVLLHVFPYTTTLPPLTLSPSASLLSLYLYRSSLPLFLFLSFSIPSLPPLLPFLVMCLSHFLLSSFLPPFPSLSPHPPDSFRPGDRVGCIQKKSDQSESFALKALSVDSLRPFIPEYIQTVVKDGQSIHSYPRRSSFSCRVGGNAWHTLMILFSTFTHFLHVLP